MTAATSNLADQYVQKVMDLIYAPKEDAERIRADLQAHLQEALSGGEDMAALVERMGDPREVAAEFMREVPLVYAGFWRRLAAFLIDAVVMSIFGLIAGAAMIWLSNNVPEHPSGLWQNVVGGAEILFVLVTANACIAILLAYFPILEGRFGQTLGKRILGTVVLSEDGLPAGYGKALLRRLSFYFEFLPFDALFIFFTPKRQRGIDILAKTIVVRAKG